MNSYLVDFLNDELKQNDYYETIRKFGEGKDWDKDILSPIVEEYEESMDVFGPYRFMDAIEDYLREQYETNSEGLKESNDLWDVISDMWDKDYFERY